MREHTIFAIEKLKIRTGESKGLATPDACLVICRNALRTLSLFKSRLGIFAQPGPSENAKAEPILNGISLAQKRGHQISKKFLQETMLRREHVICVRYFLMAGLVHAERYEINSFRYGCKYTFFCEMLSKSEMSRREPDKMEKQSMAA
jgi:hypothetical protein